MPEYNVDIPVWPRCQETDQLIPETLRKRLRSWQELFDENFHYDHGWTNTEVAERWRKLGRQLEKDLRESLPPDVTLDVNYWPVESPGQS